ncbi:hypothetical protein BJ166DRAFT_532801 [Pestalotiopsis sp. NC0098]|nr:hypothetical protein BJ166DRAFT_532801 [Pestalotiopsis sp. NC0098]
MAPESPAQFEAQTRSLVLKLKDIPTIDNLREAKNLPPVFQEAAEHIPTAENALQAILTYVASKKNDNLCKKTLKYMESCHSDADALIKIFQEVLSVPEQQRFDHYSTVVDRLQVDNLEALLNNILGNIQACLGCDRKMRNTLHQEVTAVDEAVEQAEAISPSIKSKRDGLIISNHGSGPQNINSGGGQQYNNHSGQQFNHGTFHGYKPTLETEKIQP